MDLEYVDIVSIRSWLVRGVDGAKSYKGNELESIIILASWEKHFMIVCENLSQYPRFLYQLSFSSFNTGIKYKVYKVNLFILLSLIHLIKYKKILGCYHSHKMYHNNKSPEPQIKTTYNYITFSIYFTLINKHSLWFIYD